MALMLAEAPGAGDTPPGLAAAAGGGLQEEKHNGGAEGEPAPAAMELDIAFVLDCTGSMSTYIHSACESIVAVAKAIQEQQEGEHLAVRFALVAFRDHPPQDKSFVTQVTDFVSSPLVIKIKLAQLKARGGGDGPEALSAALHHCETRLSWRTASTKIVVVIGDAPPHGVERDGDGFPGGDPGTPDLLATLRSLRDGLGAVLYTVACEPVLSRSYDFARDVYEGMAEMTDGKFLPLADAQLLPQVIVGSAKQQIAMDRMAAQLDADMAALVAEHGDDLTEEQVNEMIAAKWSDEGVQRETVDIGTLYRNTRPRDNVELFIDDQACRTLAEFKAKAKLLPRARDDDFRHMDHGRRPGAADMHHHHHAWRSADHWAPPPAPISRPGAPSIGISLGTTAMCVATWQKDAVEVISNDFGERTTPAFVSFSGEERLVGNAAKNQWARNPANTVFACKRLMGRNFADDAVQHAKARWPFAVLEGPKGQPVVEVSYGGEQRRFEAEEVTAWLLADARQQAESFFGRTVTNVVLTVPAYFTDAQRQATKDAGRIAGLNVLRIINEPVAAAIAYELDKVPPLASPDERQVVVIHFGGGCLDVTLLSIDDGVFEVRASAGDAHFGGDDLDAILVEHFAAEFKSVHGQDLTKNDRAMRRLRTQAERLKRDLTTAAKAELELDALFNGVDFTSSLTRARFEELCREALRRVLPPVTEVLTEAGLAKSEVHDVVLVGGSTRIPAVRKLVKDYFNGKKLLFNIAPEQAVARGAAIQAAILSGDDMGESGDLLLLDVTPLSLGVEAAGGVISTVIERNKTIPCRASLTVVVPADAEAGAVIRIFEGERDLASGNALLGKLPLPGVSPGPRGLARVDVQFDLDACGVLTVSARDSSDPSVTATVTIGQEKGRLSEEEIHRMVADAELFKAEDAAAARLARARNMLESQAYQIRGTLDDEKFAAVIPEETQREVAAHVEEALKWLDEHPDAEAEEFEAQQRALMDVFRPVIVKAYMGASGGAPGGMPGGFPGGGMPDMGAPDEHAGERGRSRSRSSEAGGRSRSRSRSADAQRVYQRKVDGWVSADVQRVMRRQQRLVQARARGPGPALGGRTEEEQVPEVGPKKPLAADDAHARARAALAAVSSHWEGPKIDEVD